MLLQCYGVLCSVVFSVFVMFVGFAYYDNVVITVFYRVYSLHCLVLFACVDCV